MNEIINYQQANSFRYGLGCSRYSVSKNKQCPNEARWRILCATNLYCLASGIYGFLHKIVANVKKITAHAKIQDKRQNSQHP